MFSNKRNRTCNVWQIERCRDKIRRRQTPRETARCKGLIGLNISRELIVVNHCSHRVIVFEWTHIKQLSPDWETAKGHKIVHVCACPWLRWQHQHIFLPQSMWHAWIFREMSTSQHEVCVYVCIYIYREREIHTYICIYNNNDDNDNNNVCIIMCVIRIHDNYYVYMHVYIYICT